MKGKHHRHLTLAALLGLGATGLPAQAEDIEVFFSKEASSVAPNVLFVLDTSRSMEATEGGKTRLDILKDSLRQVLKPGEEYYKALNVGIMDFGGSRSGGIDFPVADINGDAHDIDSDIPEGTAVSRVLDYISQSYTASGETPMGDALFYASSYFSGASISSQRYNQTPPAWDDANKRYNGHSLADHPATYAGTVGFTWRKTGRNCSTNWRYRPEGYTSCGENPYDCGPERTHISITPDRPKQYRIRTYSCDSSGLECSWNWPQWKAIDAAYPGDSSCGKPANPTDGSTWVECRGAELAREERLKYRLCKKSEKVWGSAPNYDSPIAYQCQSNHVILLTDGEPTRRGTRNYIASRVRPITGSSSYHDCADLSSTFGGKIPDNGRCLPELTRYMAEYDQAPDLPGDQTVSTYTIGFRLSENPSAQDFLELLARNGKGEYFDADTPGDLVNVFKRIIRDVTDSDVSFSAPSVSVDPDNRLATGKYVYRSVFTPSDKPAWRGDIIKTELSRNESGETVFSDVATFAGTLDAGDRKIYTYLGTGEDLKDLTDPANAFTTDNDKLTASALGVDESDRDNLIQWVRGQDVKDENGDGSTTDQRGHMGDSLHTTPALVDYENGTKQVLYVPTNDGLLHAFDISADTPSEIFAFIPPELLPNFKKLYANSNTETKVYGLDGNMAVWRSEDGEKTHLYLGMRRGGSNYYALDVSDPDNPEMLWTIEGGKGDFAELGQTWSTPQLTTVMADIDGTLTETRALIFGGGYDTNQDSEDASPRTDDGSGRAIFIVDAKTGDKIWSAGPGGSDSGFDYDLALSNSIPSDVRIIDLDGNGLADRLYVGDTGGRIWRVDLDEGDIGNSSGYLLADFNDGTEAGNRRFYYAPSVALDRQRRLMLAIGSGYRARPTETTTIDRFYVIEDRKAHSRPVTPPDVIREDDLGNITSDAALAVGKPGWYLELGEGEKVLAESVVFNGKVVFSTYQPEFGTRSDACNLTGSTARAYLLALADGRALADLDSSTEGLERSRTLSSVEFIPSSPYIVFSGGGSGSDGTDGDESDGDGYTPPASPPDSDSDFATILVDQEDLGRESSLSGRLSWQNR